MDHKTGELKLMHVPVRQEALPFQSDGLRSATVPKVLIVAASPRYLGGQSVMARRLIADLTRDGLSVEFLAIDPDLPRMLLFLERIKYLRTLLRTIWYVIALIKRVPQYDVVHVYSASYASFLISPTPAILISCMFRKSVILNYHSGEAEDHLQRSGRLTRWILSLPDRIVVQSPYLVSVFKQFDFSAVAIPNHVEISQIVYRERIPLQPNILIARVLEPLYNIPCAIKAFCLIKKKFPDARMTILGDGSQRKSLEHLVRELDVSNILFTGRIEHEDVPGYFDRHDVFLNTSSIDNMPVSILEAFMSGLPIVTTRAGGIGCMIRDRENGHLVDLDDHVSAASRVIELLEHPSEAVRLARLGREELQKYSWDAVGTQWQSLYSALAKRAADCHSKTQLSTPDRIPKMDDGK